MRDLSPEEELIWRKGLDAESLLRNDIFSDVVNEASETLANAILASDPSDKEGRELLYFQHKALLLIRDTLLTRLNTKEQLEFKIKTEEDDQEN